MKEKTKESKVKRKEEENWAKARHQAAQCGILLTRRKDGNGDYVCYLNKKARTNLFF